MSHGHGRRHNSQECFLWKSTCMIDLPWEVYSSRMRINKYFEVVWSSGEKEE